MKKTSLSQINNNKNQDFLLLFNFVNKVKKSAYSIAK